MPRVLAESIGFLKKVTVINLKDPSNAQLTFSITRFTIKSTDLTISHTLNLSIIFHTLPQEAVNGKNLDDSS